MKHKILAIFIVVALMLPLVFTPTEAATNAQIDQAIQEGLAWLSTQQSGSGYFGSGYVFANTATAVLAFENEGHFPGGGNDYSAQVEAGLDFLFNYCRVTGISTQTYGYAGRNDNPDSNGNGQGVYFSYNSLIYETGMVMQTIVASNTPNRVVTTGPCAGMTYQQVMEDLVDFLAWGQVDAGTGRGGWYYTPFSNGSGYGDNSVSQWPVLGLVAAEQWGINAPQFVKDEMEYWVTYIQHSSGGSGYQDPNSLVNVAKTGGLLVEFFYLGDDASSLRVQRALTYLNANWSQSLNGWYGNKGHPYAMFGVFKGLELMQVATIPNAPATPDTAAGDWWGDYSDYLVNTQIHPSAGQGYWNGFYYWDRNLATPWYIIILQASVFPVSVDIVVPDSACDVTGYDVSVFYSVERFFADGTVTVYKDGDVFDTITLTAFKGTGVANYNVAPDDLGAHTWYAVLDVTGGGITTQASDSDAGMVYATPNVADIPDQMSPFETFDLDDYQTCAGDYDVDWSVSGVPADWTVGIDTEHVVTVTAPEGAVDPVTLTFAAVFHWPGIDCDGSDDATFSPNQPPVAHAGMVYPDEKYEVYEGGTVTLDGTASYDPDGDPITFAWDFDSDGVFETPGATPVFSAATLDWPETDEVYIHLQVCDPYGACDITVAEVEIEDLAPTAAFAWSPEPQNEGSMVMFTDLSTSPVDDIVGWSWSFAGLGTDTAQHPNFTFYDNGLYTVCLTVTDDDGSTDMVCYDVTILNVPPTIDALTAPTDPVSIDDAPYTVVVDFSDPGMLDTHAVTWDWGDGNSDTQTGVTSPASASHTYAEPGVYPVQVTVTDDDGGLDTQTYQYIVVYDPNDGFVTGGGWIMSPAGAYTADPTLTGKANFGFNAKYKKGANSPDGQTEFQFQVADLNFHSTDYEWLVVAGANAKFKGTGTINGAGNYGFMLTATDSAINGGGDVDGFRIKIWDIATGVVVYDNKLGSPDNGYDTTDLGGGNIVIHTGKKN